MSQQNKDIQVFVKSLNGKSYIVDLKSNDKVQTLVKLAAAKTNSDLKEMRLIFCSKELTSQKYSSETVEKMGIQNYSTTFIIYRLRGGRSL